MPDRATDVQTLIHFLCGMKFTGEFYRGSKKDYFAMLDRRIKEYSDCERHLFTPEEDKAILESKNLVETAVRLGRSTNSVNFRRYTLRRRAVSLTPPQNETIPQIQHRARKKSRHRGVQAVKEAHDDR